MSLADIALQKAYPVTTLLDQMAACEDTFVCSYNASTKLFERAQPTQDESDMLWVYFKDKGEAWLHCWDDVLCNVLWCTSHQGKRLIIKPIKGGYNLAVKSRNVWGKAELMLEIAKLCERSHLELSQWRQVVREAPPWP